MIPVTKNRDGPRFSNGDEGRTAVFGESLIEPGCIVCVALNVVRPCFSGRHDPRRMLFDESVPARLSVDGSVEACERDVRLAGPLRRRERHPRSAFTTERSRGTGRRFVCYEQIRTLFDAHLLARESDPGNEARSVRAPAAFAMTMGTEARWKADCDAHATAHAARPAFGGRAVSHG